jgi:KUP system potassium uptake protein
VVILSILFEETPRVEPDRRAQVERLAGDIWRVALRFGFVEIPDLPAALGRVKGLRTTAPLDGAVYFASRDYVTAAPGRKRRLGGWPISLFAWMFRNAAKVVDRFDIPPASVIEIARQLEI